MAGDTTKEASCRSQVLVYKICSFVTVNNSVKTKKDSHYNTVTTFEREKNF
jgi:hypothetical protein